MTVTTTMMRGERGEEGRSVDVEPLLSSSSSSSSLPPPSFECDALRVLRLADGAHRRCLRASLPSSSSSSSSSPSSSSSSNSPPPQPLYTPALGASNNNNNNNNATTTNNNDDDAPSIYFSEPAVAAVLHSVLGPSQPVFLSSSMACR